MKKNQAHLRFPSHGAFERIIMSISKSCVNIFHFYLLIFVALHTFPDSATAQTVNKGLTKKTTIPRVADKPMLPVKKNQDLDDEEDFKDSDDDEDISDNDGGDSFFSVNGMIELENFISTYTDQEPVDSIKKNEMRLKLTMKMGGDSVYVKAVPNFYYLPTFINKGLYDDYCYTEDRSLARNGRFSTREFEATFNEFYLNVTMPLFQFRVGNQIYAWGTADTTNPTSYINPQDMRELFFKDGDEINCGVPSVSSLFFIGDYTLDIVFVPVHISAITPTQTNFWGYNYEMGPLTILQDGNYALPIAWENFGYAARFAGSVNGYDFAVSAYHGPDKTPALRPVEWVSSPEGSFVAVRPEYYTYTALGAALSFSLDKFVIQAEAIYSPDKPGVVDETAKATDSDGNLDTDAIVWPFRVRDSHYFSYAMGFNYFRGDWRFTMEWSQSKYFAPDLMSSYYTGLLTMNINRSFLNDRLSASLTGVIDTFETGFILMQQFDYDFENGITLRLSYAFIRSVDDGDVATVTMFDLFSDNDIVSLGVRYDF